MTFIVSSSLVDVFIETASGLFGIYKWSGRLFSWRLVSSILNTQFGLSNILNSTKVFFRSLKLSFTSCFCRGYLNSQLKKFIIIFTTVKYLKLGTKLEGTYNKNGSQIVYLSHHFFTFVINQKSIAKVIASTPSRQTVHVWLQIQKIINNTSYSTKILRHYWKIEWN